MTDIEAKRLEILEALKEDPELLGQICEAIARRLVEDHGITIKEKTIKAITKEMSKKPENQSITVEKKSVNLMLMSPSRKVSYLTLVKS